MAKTRHLRTSQANFPKRGEIYLTALDPALGWEIKKTRPALVIQNDVTNRYGMPTIVAAITSKVSVPPFFAPAHSKSFTGTLPNGIETKWYRAVYKVRTDFAYTKDGTYTGISFF